MAHPRTDPTGNGVVNQGREKLHWGKEVWDRLDHAVRAECERTRVAAKYLPHHRVSPETTSVPADIVTPTASNSASPAAGDGGGGGGDVFQPFRPVLMAQAAAVPPAQAALRWRPPSSPPSTTLAYMVDEGATTRLIEFWVEFSLTPQQVEHERDPGHEHHEHHHGAAHPGPPGHLPVDGSHHDQHGHHDHDKHTRHRHSTAVTLATQAANILAQAEDSLIFNGLGAFTSTLYANYVRWRPSGEPADWGLLDVIPSFAPPATVGALLPSQVISVPLKPAGAPGDPPSLYGENTFQAVTAAYATLMGNGQYGPFALTLHNVPYADSFAPLKDTLIMPADRIAPLMTAGFRDSGTLDAPGAGAAAAGAAAAAAALAAGSTPAQAQQAASDAAAAYSIAYGAMLPTDANPQPDTSTALAVAARAGSRAATAAGAGEPDADNWGEGSAYKAAVAISANYPNLPQKGNPTPIAPPGPPFGPPSYYGSLVSLGGNSMDLVVGIEPTVGFMQQDVDGNYRFRVYERLALRLKNLSAVIRLEFQ
jgi:hypothetical protein